MSKSTVSTDQDGEKSEEMESSPCHHWEGAKKKQLNSWGDDDFDNAGDCLNFVHDSGPVAMCVLGCFPEMICDVYSSAVLLEQSKKNKRMKNKKNGM